MPIPADPIADLANRDMERLFESFLIGERNACWPWLKSKNGYGYGFFPVTVAFKRPRNFLAHRVLYRLTKGQIPSGGLVLHSCDNPPCVNPVHLRLGSQQENVRDMVSRGRIVSPIGSQSGMAKMNDDMVRAIRKRHASGETVPSIARSIGLANSTIASAIRYETWRHVT